MFLQAVTFELNFRVPYNIPVNVAPLIDACAWRDMVV